MPGLGNGASAWWSGANGISATTPGLTESAATHPEVPRRTASAASSRIGVDQLHDKLADRWSQRDILPRHWIAVPSAKPAGGIPMACVIGSLLSKIGLEDPRSSN